ncbi:MFS family permease [Constrictibacter sp. MBR-5]|jgi:MFS family permease|uniref:MFS transporter n=1 Tax=Constrictibacter sp. MBR-5 TaxID=3156467 RepID=UPI00339706FB
MGLRPACDAGLVTHGARFAVAGFLTLAAGYHLSYLYKCSGALLGDHLRLAFTLSPEQLGLIGAVHFLLFALVQIPAGVLLDRYGAGHIQSALLVIAGIGSALCASSDNWIMLLTGRALIGVGVSGALLAGLRWIAQCCPPNRLALANGVLVALGTMGAVSATVPLEWVLDAVGWRGVFGGLALVALLLAICVHTTIEDRPPSNSRRMPTANLKAVLCDRTFLRVAPLSASCLGTAWAFQSLWAAPWLADVEKMPRDLVVGHMLIMACGLVCGALFLGLAAHRLRSVGVRTIDVLAGAALLFVMLEGSILFRVAPPTYVTWGAIGAFGSISVLSFTVMSERFCLNGLGSANALLNLMHMLTAFGMQWVMGAIVGQWQPDVGGHYPAPAYLAALSIALTVQLVAFAWFAFLPAVWRTRDDQRAPQPAISPGQPCAGAS